MRDDFINFDFSSAKPSIKHLSFFSCKQRNRFREKIKHVHEHKKLTLKRLSVINAPVTKITVFETNKGIGERSREALGESRSRAVCKCYDALG